jgi:hypothetical protein
MNPTDRVPQLFISFLKVTKTKWTLSLGKRLKN